MRVLSVTMLVKGREGRHALVCLGRGEVAGLTPESGIVPAAEKEPRVPCLIGEKKSQERGRR
jgi:hypothetical protein